jgi:cell division protein FtsW
MSTDRKASGTAWRARARRELSEPSRPSRELTVDHFMLVIILVLVMFGLVMVYSASAMLAEARFGNESHFLVRQAIWAVIGLAWMTAAIKVDYRQYKRPGIVLGLLVVGFVLLLAVFGFPVLNGTHRWIRLGQASFQPSELVKLALIFYVAYFIEKRGDDIDDYRRTFVPATVVAGLAMLLIAVEPDLGTALCIALVFAVMMFGAGVKLWHLGTLLIPSAPVLAGMLIFVPWRLQRLMDFMDPWKNPTTSGFQTVQSLIAIGSGGTTGLGLAEGRQKLFFLPAPHSDFIFAVVGEELGLIGTIGVLLLFGLLAWRGLRAAKHAPDRFGQLAALGITVMIVAQAFFNMSVALSILPTKGIPLPFISCGGTSLAINLVAAGILLNISKHGEILT